MQGGVIEGVPLEGMRGIFKGEKGNLSRGRKRGGSQL
jgi:hypothetical protein